MARELTHNRWNWSQEDDKWIFIERKDDGEVVYHYQKNPPKQFTKLTTKIRVLNDKLVACKDPIENTKIFKEMMIISKRMQFMSRNC